MNNIACESRRFKRKLSDTQEAFYFVFMAKAAGTNMRRGRAINAVFSQRQIGFCLERKLGRAALKVTDFCDTRCDCVILRQRGSDRNENVPHHNYIHCANTTRLSSFDRIINHPHAHIDAQVRIQSCTLTPTHDRLLARMSVHANTHEHTDVAIATH